ncbi:MAG TPA: HEAT repeat domain-containing protein, partial [Anaerolineae bacterium]
LAFGIAARFAQLVVLGGIASSAGATFYNVVPPEKRGQVQSFDAGVTSQIGIVLSGLLLLLSDRLFSVTAIFVLGMGVAVINIILVWQMRKAYGDALLKALREGLLDVFTATAHGYQHLGRDSHAVAVASAGLIDVKPTVRRVSAVILGKSKLPAATGPLTLALEDRDPEVRFEVVKALAALDARESAGAIEVRLHDAEARVRGAAIDAIAKLAPGSIDKIESALGDEDPIVRARAAIALSRAGELDRASLAINELVRSKVDADRIAGLGAVSESANGAPQTLVTQLTMDPNANVRRAAVEALTSFRNPDAERSLANALDDPDPRVRSQASDALSAVGADIQIVSAVLNTGSARAQDAALCALQKHGREARAVIVEWALRQIPHAYELRGWNSTLHQSEPLKSSRAAGYLHTLLHQREWQIEQRVLEGLRMEDSSNAMDLVSKSLHSRSKERRAQALEALDTLADKRIAHGLIPLLEETEGPATRQDARVVIQTLTTQPDKWVRALAVYALGELMSRDLEALLGRAREDPAEIVREAAGKFVSPSAATMGGAMSETLKTLGTMDRILFLRQVPLFENLAPEELESIAELASERVFSTDEFLCRQGETGDELFVVVDGRVRVEKQVEGITKTLRQLDVGEHIGELAVLREQPRSASVIAEGTGVRTLVLSGQAVRSILRDRPEVAMAMLTSLAERLSTTS